LFILFLFRLGNTIPLYGIDQESLKKSFLQLENKNAIMQIINMYSGGGSSILTPFSLGIIPFIDFVILLSTKDVTKFQDNPNLSMWAD
jgi:preprotein translocase subunit SecY